MSQSHEQLPATPTTDAAVCLDSPTRAVPNTAVGDYPVAQPEGALAAAPVLAQDPLAGFYYEALVADPVENLRDALFTCFMHNYTGFNAMLSVVHEAALAERRCEPDPERAACIDALIPGFAAGKQVLRSEPTPFELDILLGQLDTGTAPLTASFVAEVYEGAAERLSRRLLQHAEGSGDEAQIGRATQLMSLLGVEASPPQESCSQEESGGWLAQLSAFDEKYSVLTRVGGLMQLGGGVAAVELGALLALAPVSPPQARLAGVAGAAHGLDDVQAGLRTLITGKPTKTLTETLATKAAESAGLSPTNAGRVGMVVDFAAGMLNPGNVGKLAMREGAERLGREGAEHIDDAAKLGSKAEDVADGGEVVTDAQRMANEGGEQASERAAKEAPESTARRVPQGIDPAAFQRACELVRERAGHLGGEIMVQGSRAKGTARPDSDMDIAILVDLDRFDEILKDSFKRPNPGSANERTMQHAIAKGKIHARQLGLSALAKELKVIIGVEVDISVIQRDGLFDQPPYVAM